MAVMIPWRPRQNALTRSRHAPHRLVALPVLLILLACTTYFLFNWHIISAIGFPQSSHIEALSNLPNDEWRSCHGSASCCARLLSPTARPHTIVTAHMSMLSASVGGSISWQMATHRDSDIVSAAIQSAGHWDVAKSRTIIAALDDPSKHAVLVDVGANIGWYTMLAAVAGFNVIAVEPFAENVALLRHSLCLASEEVRARVQLLPYSLGHRNGMRCELWQVANVNRGDTHTICQGNSVAPAVSMMRNGGYKKLGEALMQRFDTLFANGEVTLANRSRVVVKIDVEGFEPMAIEGAQEFLRKYKPEKVYSEFGEKMIQIASQAVGESVGESQKRPAMYLDLMRKAGYDHTMQKTGVDISEAVFTRSGLST